MRKKIVAGNWKMNKSYQEAITLIEEIIIKSENVESKNNNTLIILAPPFPYLPKAAEMTGNIQKIKIAAQNCHSEESGAYTGEISASMIRSTGAEYVIIGHSERRHYFKESNEFLSKKIDAVLKNGLNLIFCCGELLPDREKGNYFSIVKDQLYESLFHLTEDEFENVIIAYEPVWAIGTGMNATSQQAQEMHAFIRSLVAEKYNLKTAENTVILYGGSCNSKNAKELFANPDVDGGLIGGAALKVEDFMGIIEAF